MMIAERKHTKSDINMLNQIVYLLNYKKKTFIEQFSETDFNNTLDYVNKMIAKLEDKRQKLPIGHRYTGVFYLKKPYTVPSEAVKIKGSAFVRKDLVMWTIESEDEYEYEKSLLSVIIKRFLLPFDLQTHFAIMVWSKFKG